MKIKRLFYLVFISLFSLLFFVVFLIYREQDESNMFNLFGFTGQYENGQINFSQPIRGSTQREVIDRVKQITANEEVAVVFSLYEGPTDKIRDFRYFVSDRDGVVDEMLPEEVQVSPNFSQSQHYVTTDRTDQSEQAQYFQTFYTGADYHLYPIDAVVDYPEAMNFSFTYYFEDSADQKYYQDLFLDAFRDFDVQYSQVEHYEYEGNQALKAQMIYLSVIMLAISMVFILFQISNHLKNIAVLKLNGYYLKDITSHLFKSYVMANFMLAIVIPLIWTAVFFRAFNPRILTFISHLLILSLSLALLYLLALIIGVFLIKIIRLSHLLKNKNINEILTNFAYVTLILTGILVLPIISQSVEKATLAIPYYLEHAGRFSQIQDIYFVDSFHDPDRAYEFNDLDAILDAENEMNERHYQIYQDFVEHDLIYRAEPQIIAGNDIQRKSKTKSFKIL